MTQYFLILYYTLINLRQKQYTNLNKMDLNWRATSFFEGNAYTASIREWNHDS